MDFNDSCEFHQCQFRKVIELIPGGSNIEVNEENKHDYIKKYCSVIMVDSIRNQTEAFIRGFEQIIPRNALALFNEREFSVKLTGISVIDG